MRFALSTCSRAFLAKAYCRIEEKKKLTWLFRLEPRCYFCDLREFRGPGSSGAKTSLRTQGKRCVIHATTQGESCTTAGPARRVAGAQDRADFERPWSPRAPAFMFQPPAVDCASCVFCPLLFSFPLLPLPVSLRRTTSQRFQHRLWG